MQIFGYSKFYQKVSHESSTLTPSPYWTFYCRRYSNTRRLVISASLTFIVRHWILE